MGLIKLKRGIIICLLVNMNNTQQSEFDLEKMFLPEWAVKPPTTGKYSNYVEEEKPTKRREGGFRRKDFRRPEPESGKRQGGAEPRQRRDRRQNRRRQDFTPLPRVKVSIILTDETVNKTVRQIKMLGRAFPLFELARRALDFPASQMVKFEVIKNKDGTIVQPLYVCLLDDTIWLSEGEAIDYVLDKHFSTFYQAEKTQIDPPKGKYTFVAQCGLSGIILGPPNHHDYQTKLRRLHAERFSHIPFEQYKMKVRIVKDEEVVKKWIEEQSWRTEYIALNIPEPVRLITRDEVIQHFRQTHLPNIIQQVESYTLSGDASRNIPCQPLQRLVRRQWEEQKRFPMRVAIFLSQKFAEQGLQFFKWDRKVTYVAISRPHYLDLEVMPVSENVKRIIEYIRTHPGSNIYQILEALAPAPKQAIQIAPENKPQETSTEAQSSVQSTEQQAAEEYTPEQTSLIADIHWLIHQGHIIEFYNGKMYVAKKPRPRPVKEQKPEEKPQEQATTPVQAAETIPAVETTDVAAVSQVEQKQEEEADVAEPVEFEELKKDTFEGEAVANPQTTDENLPVENEEKNQEQVASTDVQPDNAVPNAINPETIEQEQNKQS